MKKNNITTAERLANFSAAPDDARVDLKTVQALFGNISPCTVWRSVHLGTIPQAQKLSPNRTTWRVGDLRVALGSVQP